MKKLLIATLLITSCREPNVPKSSTKYRINMDAELSILELEGCEYYYIENDHGTIIDMEHKGNCKNIIHQNK